MQFDARVERAMSSPHEKMNITPDDNPWPTSIFTPLSEAEEVVIVKALASCGVPNASDRFCAKQRRLGWKLAAEATLLPDQ